MSRIVLSFVACGRVRFEKIQNLKKEEKNRNKKHAEKTQRKVPKHASRFKPWPLPLLVAVM
jgi:hypothetical protein